MQRSSTGPYSPTAVEVMENGGILAPAETPVEMLARVVNTITAAEIAFGSSRSEIANVRDGLEQLLWEKRITLGTPLLTNAGRLSAPLSSCVAVPLEQGQGIDGDLPMIAHYYEQNMGSGFDLSPYLDPVSTLEALNSQAVRMTEAESCERYIGNMANLDIDHPRVSEFVVAKVNRADLKHFNLSVNATEHFMDAVEDRSGFKLSDGRIVPAREVWDQVVQAAWECGDPGLIFLERFNRDNPTPSLGAYRTTAPCAEVPLTAGEACVFGYLNLASVTSADGRQVDLDAVAAATRLLVRVLDDALEASLASYPTPRSRMVMAARRKIGIGVCGFADLLGTLQVAYGTLESRAILRDILLTITFASKLESVVLARQRGTFPAFPMSWFAGGKAMDDKYGDDVSDAVIRADWKHLDRLIAQHGIRNATTTALPPSGRSALLVGASASIEPWFSLINAEGEVIETLLQAVPNADRKELEASVRLLGSCQQSSCLPDKLKMVYRNAAEISVDEHLAVVADASRCVDDGASKTVNLARSALPRVVDYTYREAWRLGLKAISVYRDGCREGQPESLASKAA